MLDPCAAVPNTARTVSLDVIGRVSIARVVFFLCSIIFGLALSYAHANYLHPEQEFWGFPYQPLGRLEWLFLFMGIAVAALSLPLSVFRPSGLILHTLYLLVYIPSLTITLGAKPEALKNYGFELATLIIGFSCAAGIVRSMAPSKWPTQPSFKIGKMSQLFLVSAQILLYFFLLLSFRDVIGFSTLDLIYDQREAGRARNALEAYSQTYLAYVFSPAVFALGLIRRSALLVALGVSGFLLMFGITAERTILVLPIVLTFLYRLLVAKQSNNYLVSWILASFAIIVLTIAYFAEDSLVLGFFGTYFLFRVIGVPGAMFWQYSDVFANRGYTYWSNVSGIGNVISAPSNLAADPAWPQLGYLVANDILGMVSNSNANLFAYDGIAAAGAWGILLACLLLAAWLVLLDRLSRRSDFRFVLLITFPMAFSLTNGSVFTLMITFGGFFWLIFFGTMAYRRNSLP